MHLNCTAFFFAECKRPIHEDVFIWLNTRFAKVALLEKIARTLLTRLHTNTNKWLNRRRNNKRWLEKLVWILSRWISRVTGMVEAIRAANSRSFEWHYSLGFLEKEKNKNKNQLGFKGRKNRVCKRKNLMGNVKN